MKVTHSTCISGQMTMINGGPLTLVQRTEGAVQVRNQWSMLSLKILAVSIKHTTRVAWIPQLAPSLMTTGTTNIAWLSLGQEQG